MFRIEYNTHTSSTWRLSGTCSNESQAISRARRLSERSDVHSVRVLDRDGYAVWFG